MIENTVTNLVDTLAEHKKDKPLIIVFKGFLYKNIKNIPNKFFENYGKIVVDEINIQNFQAEILLNMTNMIQKNVQYSWMTYEELLLTDNMLVYNFDIKIINNNLYHTKYPYDGNLSNVEDIYNKYFYNVESELDTTDNKEYDLVSKFFGDISYSKETDSYYVTYTLIENKEANLKEVPLYDIDENVEIREIDFDSQRKTVELSDDETVFLDLTQELLNSDNIPDQIQIVSTVDYEDLPNRYKERVYILQSLLREQTILYFTQKSIDTVIVEDLPKYEEILSKYWGYPSFRNLQMYKNIRESTEVVSISQAQIINDIVKQAELAKTNENYRDIYITSSTGSGKSIMFQVPALYISQEYPKENLLTIVISPLIGLMNDQVDSMHTKGIVSARTIHSNVAPYEREKILKDVNDGKVNMLYLSPETLQSRSDIKKLIGERKIGLVIIDEAHIVTTWGKTFRADYWYLGIYLQKLRKKYRFPIVTFTATAIYGGEEDMYMETRDSLNMINPISYFGKVRRDDITMVVSSYNKENKKTTEEDKKTNQEYKKKKNQLVLNRLVTFYSRNEKTLIYFPTVKLLIQFYSFLRENKSDLYDVTGIYHGQMAKEEKDEVLSSYKNGNLKFVLATKAFGMGIDISDIKNVYHYTPSGTVTDYIQEIGRVARDKNLVERGFAWLDFLPNDFKEVNKLHGMGKINRYQLLEVMQKVINLYQEKGFNRNLIVSAEDFAYIFMDNYSDQDNLDNQIKTALLLIEKDFSSPNSIGYPPFAARPRSIFGDEQIFVNQDIIKKINNSPLNRYMYLKHKLSNSNYSAVYTINLAMIWEDHYKNISFPQFKYYLFTPKEHHHLKFDHRLLLSELSYTTGINIGNVSKQKVNDIISKYNIYITEFENYISEKKRIDTYFTIKDLGEYLSRKLKINDRFKTRAMAQAFINTCFEYQKLSNFKFIKERFAVSESSYNFNNHFDQFINFLRSALDNFFNNKKDFYQDSKDYFRYYYRSEKSQYHYDVIALGLAESMELINFNVINGNNPQIYIRMNSVSPMESAIKNSKFYKNRLLSQIHRKHYISVEMLTYLFNYNAPGETVKEQINNYTTFFWDEVENYFRGKIPETVIKKLEFRSK